MRKSAFALLLLAIATPRHSGATVPQQFSVQGVLRNNAGALQSSMVNVQVDFYDAQTNGAHVAGPFTGSALAANGLFTITFTDAMVANIPNTKTGALWMQIAVGNDTFPPQQVTPTIWARESAVADVANSLACSGCVSDGMIASGIGAAKITGQLTNASIDGAKVLNPGTNFGAGVGFLGRNASNAPIVEDANQVYVTATLNAPAAGSLVVTTTFSAAYTSTGQCQFTFKLSNTAPAQGTYGYVETGFPAASATAYYPVAVTYSFPATAGQNKIYLSGYTGGCTTHGVIDVNISSVFIPSTNGSITVQTGTQ